jgi:hypothetical protein
LLRHLNLAHLLERILERVQVGLMRRVNRVNAQLNALRLEVDSGHDPMPHLFKLGNVILTKNRDQANEQDPSISTEKNKKMECSH